MAEIVVNINYENCTEHVRLIIEQSVNLALTNHHEFVTPEHLLASVMNLQEFIEYCRNRDIDYAGMKSELEAYLVSLDTVGNGVLPVLSYLFKNILVEIQEEVENAGEHLEVVDLLLSVEVNEHLFASYLIKKYLGETPDSWIDLSDYFYDDNLSVSERPDNPDTQRKQPDEESSNVMGEELFTRMMTHAGTLFESMNQLRQLEMNSANEPRKKEAWENLVTDISADYSLQKPLIGRKDELDQIIQILCQKEKNNPLLIGEAGVGKTAMIFGLAEMLDAADVLPALKGFRIYMLDMGDLVAGASYHGEFEKRMKTILEGMKNRKKCICYIDDIHNIMGTGGAGNSSLDASNILKPYLEDGSIRFIGSTTYQEFNRYMAKNKSLVRRFQQIEILEPSVEETKQIIKGIILEYETHHGIKYDADAVDYAVEQSDRLISDLFLPDKAISIIDRAGAYRQTHPLKNKRGEVLSQGRQKVDKRLIADVMAKFCKINAKALTEDSNAALKTLHDRISAEIYGQSEAIDKVVRAVKMSKAGLTIGEKPLASLLFVGPTGVGKTEVCKVLARELGISLVHFDRSEYTEKHAVAKLIGSPAGYVGYDDGGLLTDAIRKSPNCVLLLDEIEKAHSDIYNILLQVMDYATLADNKGNKVDFKNVILIMTSNAGAQYAGMASIGFGGGISRGEAMMHTVKKTFKPEFINRLSGVVVFNDMDEKMASLILDKKIRQLAEVLARKNVTLSVSPDAFALLLKNGFSSQYGAREMDRTIQNLLVPLLMDELLFGKLSKGGEACVGVESGKLVLL